MSYVVALWVPLLVMLFALGMERLEAALCGSAQRDDELDGLLADDVTEQVTRLIPVLTDTPAPLASPASTVPTSPAHLNGAFDPGQTRRAAQG